MSRVSQTRKAQSRVRAWEPAVSEGFPKSMGSDPKFGTFVEEERPLSCQTQQIKIQDIWLNCNSNKQ